MMLPGIYFAAGNILASLTGKWCLRRSIDNGASMAGTASFVDLGGGRFDYREQGQLRLPDGQCIDAERRYVFAEQANGFSVWFAETPPRLFHCVVLSRAGPRLIGEATHLCGYDRYDSHYEFDADGTFAIRHAVSGPRKQYDITTRYRRAVQI
jgi:hypothetical protein